MEDISTYKISNNSTTADAIINRLENDIDYIPTFEEFTLISDRNYTFGKASVFTLELLNKDDVSKLNTIEINSRETRPGGLKELFQSLLASCSCSSYSESRIYYMAYLLSNEGILVNIYGQEYRNKQLKRTNVLNEYKHLLETQGKINNG